MFKKSKKKDIKAEELFEQDVFADSKKKERRRDKKNAQPDRTRFQQETFQQKPPQKGKLLFKKEDVNKPTQPEPEYPQPESKEKAELSEYFEANQKQSKKLKKKAPKKEQFDDSKLSKKERKRQLEMDLYEGRALKYKDQVFRDVPQLLEYLRKNYLQIDKIAKELFEQQTFHEWLKTHSDQYSASIVEFEEIVAKIENN